ncbi:C-type mannose receptor 2-like [Mytilus californianus]|uniref:C-type mannose receptor 2-like n=1 Tax=Mytilus californianus TaxID=6549 RepID=UPI0022486EF3|nr:C-type mannose receptor 2-like [Mytilus californianus]
MDNTIDTIFDTYAEPIDGVGYTHPATISDHHRRFDDLEPTSSYENYLSVIADNKSRIKLWIAFTTVTLLACALTAGLTYIVIHSNIKVNIPSKENENNGNGNQGFQISDSWTKCPNDWMNFDDWCYKEFSERRTWFKARDYCRSIGTDLVSIHNEKETNFLINSFTQTFLWTGLSNLENNGKYMWSDGTSLDYTHWRPLEPNNLNNNENCVHLYHSNSRKWNDNNCFMSLRFICKLQIYPRCGHGVWVYYKNSCYSINTLLVVTFTEARTLCKNNGSDLVIIGSKEESNFIISQTTRYPDANFWIGLQKLRNQPYIWIDGSHPTYLIWGIDEPKADKNLCVKSSTMYGNWNGDSCSNQNGIVCEKQLLRNV